MPIKATRTVQYSLAVEDNVPKSLGSFIYNNYKKFGDRFFHDWTKSQNEVPSIRMFYYSMEDKDVPGRYNTPLKVANQILGKTGTGIIDADDELESSILSDIYLIRSYHLYCLNAVGVSLTKVNETIDF